MECKGGKWEQRLWGFQLLVSVVLGDITWLTFTTEELMGNNRRQVPLPTHRASQTPTVAFENSKNHSMVARASITWAGYGFFWTWKNQEQENQLLLNHEPLSVITVTGKYHGIMKPTEESMSSQVSKYALAFK